MGYPRCNRIPLLPSMCMMADLHTAVDKNPGSKVKYPALTRDATSITSGPSLGL